MSGVKNGALIVGGLLVGAAAWWWWRGRGNQAVAVDFGSIGDSVAAAAESVTSTVLGAIGMRGIRNNNPGNIRHSSTRWQGMAAQQTDSAFVQFTSPEYGIRALSKVLDTYSRNYNLNTVRGIISRWAPPSENNTAAYVAAVARALNVGPDERINVQARKADLVQAIIRHENGIQPYQLATINTGVTLA